MFTPEEIEHARAVLDDIARVAVEAQNALEDKRKLEEENAHLELVIKNIRSVLGEGVPGGIKTVATPEPEPEPEPEIVEAVSGTIKLQYTDVDNVKATQYVQVDNIHDIDAELTQAIDDIRHSGRPPKGHTATYRIYEADSDRQIGRTQEYDWEFTA